MSDPYDTGPRAATTDLWDDRQHTPQRPSPAGESWNSLLFGAIIFAVAGFYFAWSTAAAAQFAMWSLRGLAIAFAAAFVLSLIAPRVSSLVSVLVIALAALLLCSAGIWMEIATRGRDLFGWLLILMGVFDAAEVMRHVSARRAMRG